jgi:transcriptional regulator with XRE-family HTH domain
MLNFAVNDASPSLPYALWHMETMGNRIRRIRETKGLTLEQVAKLVGTTKGAISQWENDATKNIRPENLLKFCEEFGTDPWYVVFGPERRAPAPAPRPSRRRTGA